MPEDKRLSKPDARFGKSFFDGDSGPQALGERALFNGSPHAENATGRHATVRRSLINLIVQYVPDMSWLSDQGVDRSRLNAQGFADSKPVADNSTEEGRAQNRRVELIKM